MTIYRVTGSGQRRGLGNGGVRAVDQSGSAYTPIQAALGQSSTATAQPTARAMINAALTAAWALSGSPSTAGGAALVQGSTLSAQPTAKANASAALSQSSTLAGKPSARVPLQAAFSQTSTATGKPAARIGIAAGLSQSSALTGAPARLAMITASLSQSTTLTAAPRNNTSVGWRERWLGAYGARSTLVLAIDEANRNLAQDAQNKGIANAAAIVQTNTRVTTVEGRIDTEAARITSLQSTVSGKADSSALDTLSTRVTVTEGKIDAQAASITSLNTTVSGKASATAVDALTTRVQATEQGIQAQAESITQVSATVNGKSKITRGPTPPPNPAIDDYWIDTSDGNRPKTWNGTAWVAAGDVRIGQTATATQELSARAETLENGQVALKAIHGVYLNVDGKISGIQSVNDGILSKFEVLADVFRVISSGLTGFEIMGGYQRNYSNGAQLVMGHNFGSGDLILWYGPNIGAAACTKQNATIWFDKSGSAYFGGSLSAGVLKNGAQSTQVSATAQVETGNFSSNGNARTITYSLSYGNNGTLQTSGAAGTAGPTSATVTLQRSVNGGAWTTLASFTATGQKTVTNDPELGYVVQIGCSGSSTFTDNSGGLGPINYRAVVSNGSGNWPWINGQGSAGQQSLTILSIEQ